MIANVHLGTYISVYMYIYLSAAGGLCGYPRQVAELHKSGLVWARMRPTLETWPTSTGTCGYTFAEPLLLSSAAPVGGCFVLSALALWFFIYIE